MKFYEFIRQAYLHGFRDGCIVGMFIGLGIFLAVRYWFK